MAVRKSERRKLRRQLISRTARIWSRLNKRLNRDLNEIIQSWLKKLIKQAESDIASGDVSNAPYIPEKFIKVLQQTLREALAYGYWLQELYLYEIRGKKYKGKITLSEGNDVKELLENFIVSGEWNDVIPEDAVNWINNYVPKLAGVLSQDVLEKTRDVIRNSLLEGSTLKERIKALQEAAPELAAMTQHRLEAIARTEITRADTLGRLAAMKANDDVIGVEFSAIMDDRTTEMCASRHGLVMRLDDPRLPENTPPIHINCRSMLISLTVYDYPDGLLTSHEFDEIPAGIQRPEDIEEVKKILENELISIQTGALSGALNNENDPDGKKRDVHAELFYEELRNSKSEPIIEKLSKNSGIPLKAAQKVFEHIFLNEYDLYQGKKRFFPDYDISQSIQRLLDGKNIQQHDIVLLYHERLEYEFMNKYHQTADEAHDLTNLYYNYSEALDSLRKKGNSNNGVDLSRKRNRRKN